MRRFILTGVLALLAWPASAESEEATLFTASLLNLINSYRAEHGMPVLSPAEQLAVLAREHSLYMAEQGDINHDRFEQRYHRAGRQRCVENVGWNYRDPYEQFKGWQNSPGHNAAMLDPKIKLGGIAVFDAYVTFFACS